MFLSNLITLKNKRFISVVILFCFTQILYSQGVFKGYKNYSLNYYKGYVSDANKVNGDLVNDYIKGFSFDLSRVPIGDKLWHEVFNFPETGYHFLWLDIGDKQKLGSLCALAKYVDFNIITNSRFDVDIRSSLGAAYANKIFDPVNNHENIIFSRHLNFFFEFNISAEYKIIKDKDFFLNGGISIMHASNGETRMPNGGLSATNYFIGLSKKNIAQKTESKIDNAKFDRFHFTLGSSIGRKEDWRWGSDKFLELSVSADFLYSLNKKQQIGIGLDMFYDESLMSYSNHNLEPVDTKSEAVSGGIHITHEFNLHPLYIIYKTGYHVLSDVEKSNFNLIGFRYVVYENLYMHMYHKSHGFFYGDNMQWGVGFEF